MKWTARLHHKNFIDSPNQQVSKVPKPPLDTLDTSAIGGNEKNFTITRIDIEQRYPDTLNLSTGQTVHLSAVLDNALPAEVDPLGIGDWPDLMNPETLHAFAASLLQTGEIIEASE